MRASELCYWLNGFFELSGSQDALTKEQFKCLQAHLNLALMTEQDNRSDGLKFLNFLEGVLGTAEAGATNEATQAIRKRLADEFEHVIDPSYNLDPKKAQAVHDAWKDNRRPGHGPNHSDAVYRC